MIKKYDNVRIHLLRVHKRISCVYTRDLLCMHNTLVHALGQGPQGPGTQKRRWAGPRPWTAPFLGPWPRACTRVLCMHKRSLVYTQEILLCIHNKCINVTPGVMLRHYWPLLRHYWPLLRHYWPLLRHYCATIGYYWPLFGAVAAENNLP